MPPVTILPTLYYRKQINRGNIAAAVIMSIFGVGMIFCVYLVKRGYFEDNDIGHVAHQDEDMSAELRPVA